MVEDPCPEVWGQVFGDRPLYLEIGCGKGDFLLQQALARPEAAFVGIEGQASVVLRALEKAAAASGAAGEPSLCGNLRFACAFVNGLEELFEPESLSGIYLNFSDPWPKARHAKRRLTHRDRLANYAKAVRPGGFLEFKTDNEDLYDFTLEEIAAGGYPILEQTRDLHSSDYSSRLTMTEYEKKFSAMGKNINYVKIKLR